MNSNEQSNGPGSQPDRSFMTSSSECVFSSPQEREDVIDRYLVGRLGSKKRREFEEHYFLCDLCFRELQVKEGIATVVQKQSAETVGVVVKAKTHDRRSYLGDFFTSIVEKYFSVKWLSAGLAFAVVLVLLFMGRGLLDAPDLEEQRRLFAANSQPSPFMESLLERNLRAGNVTVLSPPNGFNVQDDLPFRWKRDDAAELTIIILNNREEELFTFTTTTNEYIFENAADQLQPGLYYWKLEDEDELRHAGKFFVNKPD